MSIIFRIVGVFIYSIFSKKSFDELNSDPQPIHYFIGLVFTSIFIFVLVFFGQKEILRDFVVSVVLLWLALIIYALFKHFKKNDNPFK